MQFLIFRKVKELWDTWDLRLCIITSLLLQAFLLLLAPSRQRSRSNLLFRSIWATYLLAEWVAAVAIGLITKSLGGPKDPEGNDDLFALWASFLLMHLGGPDGITSLSLEDNELWIRHLFGLFLQVFSAAYSFYLTANRNKLWLPTVLVFIGGNIKFSERTWALRLASLDRFGATTLPNPNPGPDYQEAAAVYCNTRSVQVTAVQPAGVIGNFISSSEPTDDITSTVEGARQKNLREMKLLEVAYSLFGTFKVLIVGFLLSSKHRESSRSYFLQLKSATRAFRIVEYELNFMYQVLHTKAVVIHGKVGYFLRFISFCSTILALLVFHFIGKQGFGKFEIGVTYALFIGAVVLDTISGFKLMVSDWILMVAKDSWIINHIPTIYLSRTRWSGSVSQNNMVSHCLAPDIRRLHELHSYRQKFGVLETTGMILRNFSSSETVPKYLKEFIFEELKSKSKKASNLRDAIEACSQRGNSALSQTSSSYITLKWSVGEFQFAESLLLWHLATELCHNICEDNSDSSDSEVGTICKRLARFSFRSFVHKGRAEESRTNRVDEGARKKRICKLLSNYMFYLLVNNSAMLAPVLGNWNIVFRDTCAEAKRFFKRHKLSSHWYACKKIISVEPQLRSTAIKGDSCKSVLFDSCILAQQLTEDYNRWEIMSRVWVEMLSYAAINCRPFVHAQQLSKGGELLTFTWLLMNHLGLGTQFAEQEQQAGTKMPTIIK
ncbi:hypothetical protein PanWU01x14_050810 [Parasponia andersonii]|uniref:DUF4220 domain-containing protein n=1 Tax=Parasponia andersonii TaxID=3476 RepID=A0A2P5DLS5_PARAD|nr:hypothetical protein PanWU01x14_050810 [Parasponia andersonii]